MKMNLLKTLNIKQIYHPYYLWECYKNGFYAPKNKNINGEEIYREYLSDLENFEYGIKMVFNKWKYSSEHFLTNPNINRIAWLGQASCCIDKGLSSFYRAGFCKLTENQQNEANQWAELRIYDFLKGKYEV